ncbi:MAG: dihydrodipicolinate synthase family protein [Firmicutes bacterium]|nr:dihydrodipicolinate synthase family protein [Bacillota bacterium]
MGKLEGVICPLVTPLDEEERVDEWDVRSLVEHVIGGGVSVIFPLGSMGEGILLAEEEKGRLVEIVVDQARGRVPVMVGVADTSTERIIRNAKRARALGADGIVISAPCYFGIGRQEEVVDFHRRVLDSVDLPALLYYLPGRTHTFMTIDTIVELSEDPRVLGIKDSCGDFTFFRRLVAAMEGREDFSVFQGNEWVFDASLLVGADGIAPGVSSLVPRLCHELFIAGKSGDISEARRLQVKLLRIFDIYGANAETWAAGMKEALRAAGICKTANPARPFVALDDAGLRGVRDVLEREGILESQQL